MTQLDAYMHLKTKQDPSLCRYYKKQSCWVFRDGGTAGIWLQQKDFFHLWQESYCSYPGLKPIVIIPRNIQY